MTLNNQEMVLDLIEWVAAKERSYEETMSAWRTSCPRLTVWEDANELGFVRVDHATLRATPEGLEALRTMRRS